jgi:hypothetical protein
MVNAARPERLPTTADYIALSPTLAFFRPLTEPAEEGAQSHDGWPLSVEQPACDGITGSRDDTPPAERLVADRMNDSEWPPRRREHRDRPLSVIRRFCKDTGERCVDHVRPPGGDHARRSRPSISCDGRPAGLRRGERPGRVASSDAHAARHRTSRAGQRGTQSHWYAGKISLCVALPDTARRT